MNNQPDESGQTGERRSWWSRILLTEFGLVRHEREQLFRETADAATDTALAFWAVTLGSGLIAILGLLQNSTAVVIGAMLVAPLLGPLMGIGMSIAVGDVRLFAQTTVTMLLVTVGIVGLSALVTALMPFASVTSEIASRTEPTLLDLAIAIASGMAAGIVTVSRNRRLSASIPGVAVAVALVPPLGVAGFAVGSGGQWSIFAGAILLYGANLAGIVLTTTGLFIGVGFFKPHLVRVARDWHEADRGTGLARRLDDFAFLKRRRMGKPVQRVALLIAFTALVSIPLVISFNRAMTELSLGQLANIVEGDISAQSGGLIVNRRINLSGGEPVLIFDVLSQQVIGEEAIARLQRKAADQFGRPLDLRINQRVFASRDALEQAAALSSGQTASDEIDDSKRLDGTASAMIAMSEGWVLPENARFAGGRLNVPAEGAGTTLTIVLAVEGPALHQDATGLLERVIASDLGWSRDRVEIVQVQSGTREDREITSALNALKLSPGFVLRSSQPQSLADFPGLEPKDAQLLRSRTIEDKDIPEGMFCLAATLDAPCEEN